MSTDVRKLFNNIIPVACTFMSVKERVKERWTLFDTCIAVCLLGVGSTIYKNISTFYADYAKGLDFDRVQYSYFIAAPNIGQFISIANSHLNKYLFSNTLQKTLFYGSFAAVFVIFLPIAEFIDDTWKRLIWCICMFILYGDCFALFASTIFHTASVYTSVDKRGSVISYLNLYWPLATLFYLPVSYMIADINIYMPFFTFGAFLITVNVCTYYCLWKRKFGLLDDINIVYDTNEEHSRFSNGMYVHFNFLHEYPFWYHRFWAK